MSTDEQVLEPLRATVYFGRKVTPKQYENGEASLHLQVPIDLGDDQDTINAKIVETFSAAKTHVFNQLGLDFNLDPLTNVVIETASRVLGATPVNSSPSSVVQAPGGSTPTEAFVPNTAYESMSKPDQKAFRAADIAANPNGWFDNRADKKGKQPDYKSKTTNSAVPAGTGHWLS